MKANHVRCLNDFVTAQIAFYAQCNQHMCDLQRELTSTSLSSIRGQINDLTSPSDENKISLGPGKRHAKALYDYDAHDSKELSLMANEVIVVSQSGDLDADWMIGERGNQRGKVPLAYLEILN
jgi:endophilin-B